MTKVGIILIFIVASVQAFSQGLPDSIQLRFRNVPKDSSYVIQLNALATQFLKTNPLASRTIAYYTSDFSSAIKYTQGYARALTVIGNSYWYEGVYEFAQNYYLLAARQYRSIADSVGLGQVYNNIGEVNKRLGEYQKALDYLQQSMLLKKEDTTRAITLYNIGELYIIMRNYDEATRYINESLALARQNNNERVIAYDYWSIARIKSQQGFLAEALTNFARAEELWKKLGETRSLIQTYHNVSETYRKAKQLNKAQYYLDQASELAKKINVPDLRIITHLEYSRLDSVRGNYAQALHHLSQHNALKDSVYNLLKAEQIARVQAIYESEIKSLENQQLRNEKVLKDQQLRSKENLITVISIGLLLVVSLATMLFRQRQQILITNKKLQEQNSEIHEQKEAIEVQSVVLIKFNEELKELNKTLESRIEERSKQIVVQSQKLAEYTFVNAHKLRAPVASILGLIELVHQVDPKERDQILSHLKICGEQLDCIIREISKSLEADVVKEVKKSQ